MPRKKHSDANRRNGKPTSPKKAERALRASEVRPHWHQTSHTLWFRSCVVKRYFYPSRDAEVILAAFEELAWPPFIDDPLPREKGRNSKTRLQNFIRNFNRRINCTLLSLHGNGFGTGIGWDAADLTPSDTI